MVGSFDETKSNAGIQRESVGYVLPLFDGYVKYTTVCASKNLNEGGFADLEFTARNIRDVYTTIRASKVRMATGCQKALLADEKKRFEREVTEKLTELRICELGSLKLGSKVALLKENLVGTANASDWCMYGIDIAKYFKIQSTEYDALDVLKIS